MTCLRTRWWRGINLQLAAEEIVLALDEVVQDAPDALNLLEITLFGRGHVLGVKFVEPDTLTVVRALFRLVRNGSRWYQGSFVLYLAGHLKVQKLLQVPLVGGISGVDLVVLVVGLDEVLGNGA